MPAPPFPEISNGGPGIETLLSVVYSAGVAARPHQRSSGMVEVLSTTPARLFGLPTKGAIEVGRDADLVLLGPGRAADDHARPTSTTRATTRRTRGCRSAARSAGCSSGAGRRGMRRAGSSSADLG